MERYLCPVLWERVSHTNTSSGPPPDSLCTSLRSPPRTSPLARHTDTHTHTRVIQQRSNSTLNFLSLQPVTKHLLFEVGYFGRGLVPKLKGNVHHHVHSFIHQAMEGGEGLRHALQTPTTVTDARTNVTSSKNDWLLLLRRAENVFVIEPKCTKNTHYSYFLCCSVSSPTNVSISCVDVWGWR